MNTFRKSVSMGLLFFVLGLAIFLSAAPGAAAPAGKPATKTPTRTVTPSMA